MRGKLKFIWLSLLLFFSCGNDHGNIFHVDIVNPLDEGSDISLVQVAAGSFLMGSTLLPAYTIITSPGGGQYISYNPERPVHSVTVQGFKISTREITQEQYKAVMGVDPSKYSGFSDMPVEQVTWEQAAGFCNKLSEITGLELCYNLSTWECDFSRGGYRLPTEAEWEYTCRAGVPGEYAAAGSQEGLSRVAWYSGNSASTPHQVAILSANAAGLYDMQGNVWEWCNDRYGYYNCNSQADPRGPANGQFRTARGGSWASTAEDCRVAARRAFDPKQANYTVGFRIVRR